MKRLFLILILTSCISTEALNAPEVEQVDTVQMYKRAHNPPPPVPPMDTTEVNDTTRVPIGFDVEVEDWDEKVIEL